MSPSHVVVDGSNIATEGRSSPSLQQLDDAIRQFQAEFPGTEVIVVVDATFGHRIDPSERAIFDEAVAHGELVSPPAGAIGRGDAFVLRVAEKVGAQVLSNDSFQEFHAEHPWLFDDGRLIGGKPIPGIGWIFTPRLPVRGPRSRAVTSTGGGRGRRTRSDVDGSSRGRSPSKVAQAAIALATNEAAGLVKVVRAPKAPKVGDVIRVPESGEVIKVAKAAKAAKTVKAAKEPAKAAKATKAAKVTKATKATEEPAKATKAAKVTKAAKAAKAAKTTKATKATKVAKTTKATTATKVAKTTKTAKAVKATKASKAVDEMAEPLEVTKPAPFTRATRATKKAGITGLGATLDGAAQETTLAPSPNDTAGPSRPSRRGRRGRGSAAASVQAAIEAATEEALGSPVAATAEAAPVAASSRPRRRTQDPATPTAVNDPLTFLTFVTEHPLGSLVQGTVDSFVSHGAMVDVNGMLCYLPLTGLGDPPPRRAREVLDRDEQGSFVVVALDPPRRGAELAVPGLVPTKNTESEKVKPARRSRRGARQS